MILTLKKLDVEGILFFFFLFAGICIGLDFILPFSFQYPQEHQSPFFRMLVPWSEGGPVQLFVTLAIVIGQGLALNRISKSHRIMGSKTGLPLLFFLLLNTLFPEQLLLNPNLITNSLFIFILYRILQLLDNGRDINRVLLDVGTALGISFLFARETLFLLPLVIGGIYLFAFYDLNRFFLLIFSTFMPLMVAFTLLFVFEKTSLISGYFPEALTLFLPNPEIHSPKFYSVFSILGFLLLVATFSVMGQTSQKSSKIRKVFQFFLLFLLIAGSILVFFRSDFWINAGLFAIPGSMFLAYYFEHSRFPKINSILFLGLLGAIIYSRFL